jgi:O-antigen ligase
MGYSVAYQEKSNFPFYTALAFLFLEYARPQSFIPGLGYLRLSMITLIILLIILLAKNDLLKLNNIQTKMYIALILLMTLQVPLAVNNFWAFKIWEILIQYFILYLIIVNFVDSPSKMKIYVKTWVIINLGAALVGALNGGKVPGSGFMGDENDFCLVMNMAIPFAYFLAIESQSTREKLFYFAAVGVFIAANVSSFSRGGFVGLLPVLLYCWYKTPNKRILTLISAVAMSVLVIYFTASSEYWSEVRSIKEQNIESGTGATRWYFWKCGLRMFADNPIIGVGQGNFPWTLDPYEDPEGFAGRKHSGHVAHSLYITLISELGIVGFLIVSIMVFTSIMNLIYILRIQKRDQFKRIQAYFDIGFLHQLHSMRPIILGIIGAWIGYLISGTFISVLYYPHLWILMAISTATRNIFDTSIQRELLKNSDIAANRP